MAPVIERGVAVGLGRGTEAGATRLPLSRSLWGLIVKPGRCKRSRPCASVVVIRAGAKYGVGLVGIPGSRRAGRAGFLRR